MNILQAGHFDIFCVYLIDYGCARSSKCFGALHTHTHTHTHFSLGNSVSRADCAFNVSLSNMSRNLVTVKTAFYNNHRLSWFWRWVLVLGRNECVKGRRNAAIMLRRQNRNKKIQLAAAATGLKRKQMFECLVLSSIIIKPLSWCARWSSSAWARSCFWIANSKNAS